MKVKDTEEMRYGEEKLPASQQAIKTHRWMYGIHFPWYTWELQWKILKFGKCHEDYVMFHSFRSEVYGRRKALQSILIKNVWFFTRKLRSQGYGGPNSRIKNIRGLFRKCVTQGFWNPDELQYLTDSRKCSKRDRQ